MEFFSLHESGVYSRAVWIWMQNTLIYTLDEALAQQLQSEMNESIEQSNKSVLNRNSPARESLHAIMEEQLQEERKKKEFVSTEKFQSCRITSDLRSHFLFICIYN